MTDITVSRKTTTFRLKIKNTKNFGKGLVKKLKTEINWGKE